MDWVNHLRDGGIEVKEDPMVKVGADQTGKDYRACILATEHPEGYSFGVALLPGQHQDDQSEICHQAMVRFNRIAEHGAEPDGWQKRKDGKYQLWLTLHQLDPWLTEK